MEWILLSVKVSLTEALIFEEQKLAKQEQHDPDTGANATPAGISAKGLARRRFGKAGIGASGVILTLASQPGMAATGVCTTPSGFLSKPMSSHTARDACGGRSPGYWKTHPELWQPLAFTKTTTKFKDVFPCTRSTSGLVPYSLLEVTDPTLMPNGTDKDNVAMHCVAALLNARAGTTPVLNEAKVKQIWAQYAASGYYTPTLGAKPWYGADIVRYLTSTFVLEDQKP
jgi:hypothetical protein